MNRINITGLRLGRWVVIEPRYDKHSQRLQWLCRCDCGSTKLVTSQVLRDGRSKSCGCLFSDTLKQRNTTHGRSRGPEHRTWCGIKTRCYNPKISNFKNYGGRGIRVHDKWRNDFSSFLQDVGQRPSNAHSLDRIDVNGHYEPGNVRWATRVEQRRNQRCKKIEDFSNEELLYELRKRKVIQ